MYRHPNPKWSNSRSASALEYEYDYQLRRLHLRMDKVIAALNYAPENLRLLKERAKIQRTIYEVEEHARADNISLSRGLLIHPDYSSYGDSAYSRFTANQMVNRIRSDVEQGVAATRKRHNIENAKEVDEKFDAQIATWTWKGRRL